MAHRLNAVLRKLKDFNLSRLVVLMIRGRDISAGMARRSSSVYSVVIVPMNIAIFSIGGFKHPRGTS